MSETTEQAQVEDKEQVFKLLADAVQGHLHIEPAVDEAKVRAIAGEEIERHQSFAPLAVEVRGTGREPVRVDGAHRQFAELLALMDEGHRNLMLVGPAGCGKTTMARQVAHALNLPFGFLSLSAGVTETHLLGRVLPQSDGSWQYQKSLFVKLYEEGGVFLLDEIDAADANLLVAVNAAMANGVLANPVTGTVHERHPDCYILAAGNTWGMGADVQYVGRNQLDASTRDRFVLAMLTVDYDARLEKAIAHGSLPDADAAALIKWVTGLRRRIADNRIRRVASTRLVANGVMAMKAGRTLEQVKARYFVDWSRDERAKIGEEE